MKQPVSPSILLPPLVLTMSECHLGSLWSQQIQDDSQGLIYLFLVWLSEQWFSTVLSCFFSTGGCWTQQLAVCLVSPFPSVEHHGGQASSSQPLPPQCPLAGWLLLTVFWRWHLCHLTVSLGVIFLNLGTWTHSKQPGALVSSSPNWSWFPS